jgi:hypothetical protein
MNSRKTVEPQRTASKDTNGEKPSANLEPEKIREAAYYKWEAAGCPCSDGIDFWLEAESELKSNRPSKPK